MIVLTGIICFNINIIECKFNKLNKTKQEKESFNINIIECKLVIKKRIS